MSVAVDDVGADLTGLESVWERGMGAAYAYYRGHAASRVALAAAMVETALELHDLGGGAPDPARLLLGDLCLARASRLLAATRDQRLQVGFARAMEQVAAAAAGGPAARPLRTLLVALLGTPA